MLVKFNVCLGRKMLFDSTHLKKYIPMNASTLLYKFTMIDESYCVHCIAWFIHYMYKHALHGGGTVINMRS